jgi:hypothetical protein
LCWHIHKPEAPFPLTTMGNKHSSAHGGMVSAGGRKHQLRVLQEQQMASIRQMHARMDALAAARQRELDAAVAAGISLAHRPETPETPEPEDDKSDGGSMDGGMMDGGSMGAPPSMGGRAGDGGDGSAAGQRLTFNSAEGKWEFK